MSGEAVGGALIGIFTELSFLDSHMRLAQVLVWEVGVTVIIGGFGCLMVEV